MAHLILPLATDHDVKRFDCGTELLNTWLRDTAGQHSRKMLSKTYVLVDQCAAQTIIGFYSISIRAMTPVADLPGDMQRRLPRNIPGYTLGRLAVAREAQGHGWGELLLAHAMRRIRLTAETIGGVFMFVDAKDSAAAAFYAKYQFTAMPSNPLILVKPLAEVPV